MSLLCPKFELIKKASKEGLKVHIHGRGNRRFSGFVREISEERLSAKLTDAEQVFWFVGGNAANHLSVFLAP